MKTSKSNICSYTEHGYESSSCLNSLQRWHFDHWTELNQSNSDEDSKAAQVTNHLLPAVSQKMSLVWLEPCFLSQY